MIQSTNNANTVKPNLISSRNHPSIKRIRSLHLQDERERAKAFLIEGVRFVAEAVQHHAHIESLIVAPQLLEHPSGQKLIRQQKRIGTPCLEVTPEVFHSIAQADDPQGIGAVVRQQWWPLERADPRYGLCWIALETVQSPGNLGTILRTSDSVGGAGIILIGDAIDPYNSAAVRASMGAMFSQRFVRTNWANFIAWKQRRQCVLVGTSPKATADYHAVAYPQPLILLMGSERKGLSEEHQALCDLMVQIPMVGRSDSLNLAIATSVMLYEIFNQRRGAATASEGLHPLCRAQGVNGS